MDTPAATEMLAALPKDSASVAIIAQHAKQGDPDAMFAMCIFAHEHNDHELAVSWAEKASAAGNSEAKVFSSLFFSSLLASPDVARREAGGEYTTH